MPSLGRLPHRDARVTVAHQDDIPRMEAFHLAHDVLDRGLPPGRYASLLGQPRQRERMRAMAERP